MSDREDMVALADELKAFLDRSTMNDGADKFLWKVEAALRSAAQAEPGYVVKPVDDNTPYPSQDAMKAAVMLEVQRALGAVQTVVIGQLIQQAIDAAIAALPAPATASAGWQDIDSAPKDGTDIILGALEQTYEGQPVASRVTIGHWTTDEECREQIGDCGGGCRCPEYRYHDPSWISWDGGFTEQNQPTHWMPLPAAPTKRSAT